MSLSLPCSTEMEERSLREDKLDDDRTLRMRLRALCASSSVFCTEPQIQWSDCICFIMYGRLGYLAPLVLCVV